MAGGQTNYERGSMGVDAQSGTYTGFMAGTKYGGAAIALIVILPTLIFALGLHWFPALIGTVVIGVVIGVALKLKGIWYGALIGSAVLLAAAIFIALLLS